MSRRLAYLALSAVSALLWADPRAAGALQKLPPARDRRSEVRAAEEARFVIAPYLQDVRTDGVVIVWETDVPASGVVRLDLPGRGTAFLSPPGLHHAVRLSGLHPGTRYRYVVAIRGAGALGSGRRAARDPAPPPREVRSEPAEFVTAPLNAPFTFLVYGDNRDRDADHAQVIQAMLPEAPDFLIQTGDMTGNAGEDHLWRRYFAVAAPLLRSAPMYPALGNHELRGDPDASHFFRYFVLPGAEQPRRKVVYYAFRYSNAVFIALDGNRPYDPEQGDWLERTLAQASSDRSVRHIFVFLHQPPYAVGGYCGSARAQKRFVPLFSRYRVRAVFGGHEHAYQHLERDGVRYFISGGGGAPLYLRADPCSEADQRALRLFRAEHHYLRVRVKGDEALLTAINKSGQVMEQVALHRPSPQEPEARVAAAAGPSPLEKVALALPLAMATGGTVGTGIFLLLRPRRRRPDLLPGGEAPPPLPRRRSS